MASMEPSSGDDGEPLWRQLRRRASHCASMEPSSGDDGENSALRPWLGSTRFNGAVVRGRRRESALRPMRSAISGSFNGAVVRGRRRGVLGRRNALFFAALQWSRRPGTTERDLRGADLRGADLSLQWSRRPGTTESWWVCPPPPPPEEASMEPSSGDDGEGRCCSRAILRSMSRFNGAVVRGRRRVWYWPFVHEPNHQMLQWSRRPGTTERTVRRGAGDRRQCFNGAVVRGRRRGGLCVGCRRKQLHASMEPSSGDDGERCRRLARSSRRQRLQWSRRPGTTERDDAGKSAGACRRRASMEPSSGDDGETPTWPEPALPAPACFNGAVVRGRRRARRGRPPTKRCATCFNGAVVRGRRRAPAGCRSAHCPRSFNGAVVRGRRRGVLGRRNALFFAALQWSRRPGTTESMGGGYRSVHAGCASMEPSSGDDGECLL